jgi:NTP pyrophosphatase (non-canonical NTP hydrolase)
VSGDTQAVTAAAVSGLDFATLRRQNEARARRWHPGFPEDDDWNGADWSNAMCGEAGEAANVVKKLRRHETGHHGARDGDEAHLHDALADELADVIIYVDLLAAKYGIDLAVAVASKFNEVSARQGFPERLPLASVPVREKP